VLDSHLNPSRRSRGNWLPTIISTEEENEDDDGTHLNHPLSDPELDDVRNESLSRHIAAVMVLLREMYSLEIQVYSTKSGRKEDVGARNRRIKEADLLLQKITETLDRWETSHYEYEWTKAELDVIKEIHEIARKKWSIREPQGSSSYYQFTP